VSAASDVCINKGMHYGAKDYNVCERCIMGLFPDGCVDFKMKGKPPGMENLSWPAIHKLTAPVIIPQQTQMIMETGEIERPWRKR